METEQAEEIIAEPIIEAAEDAVDVIEADDEEEGGSNIVTFGDDEAPDDKDDIPAPEWVKGLRKTNREQAREIAALKKATVKADDTISPLSAKPTLGQAGYDEAKYEESLVKWYDEKKAHEAAKAAKESEAETQRVAWQSRLEEYGEAKKSFDPETIEDAEAIARESLSETQQGVLIEALGKGAAPLLVGLATNDKRLKALADIKNPIRFAAEAAKLESIMKTSTRRPKTAPESRVVGGASAQMGNKTLEKLEAEADKTGDRTKVLAFKRQQKLAKQ